MTGAEATAAQLVRALRPPSGPTVVRMLLGAQLCRLRQASGLTREDAGRAIRASYAKIRRLELGSVGCKERDVADLLTLYGVTGEPGREALLALARQANAQGWWHQYGDILPSWFELYLGLEQAASLVRSYEVQFVPGLLQTEGYARAVVELGLPGGTAEEVERRVGLRMARQALLTRPDAPHLWVVVDEAALRRPVGGTQVMRRQLEHLVAATALANVTLQVAPFHCGGHAAAGGPFSILRFGEPELPDVVYLEQLTSALYLDKRQDVDHYLAVMERLCVEAEPPTQTPEMLRRIGAEL
jgi:transcriptional regulator with XRE-family HTH domain